MDLQEKTKAFGSILLFLAVLTRLFVPGTRDAIREYLSRPEHAAFLIYLETGTDTRSSFSPPQAEPVGAGAAEATVPTTAAPSEPTAPRKADAKSIAVYYGTKIDVDLQALLDAPLNLQTREGLPSVLLYSTHSSESYTPEEEIYTPSGDYRTLDKGFNMLSIGQALEENLQKQGFSVLRDQAIHDSPSYNYAYSHARKSAAAFLNENPTIRLVLDLHRDAVETKSGQLRPLVPGSTPPTAQIMLVVGTDGTGLKHDNWEQNLSLALKLHTILEELCPGITRPLSIRAQRFNQDLSAGSLLVEIGATGNSRAEALAATQILGTAIGELFRRYGAP